MHPLYHPVALRVVGGCPDMSNTMDVKPLLKGMGHKLRPVI